MGEGWRHGQADVSEWTRKPDALGRGYALWPPLFSHFRRPQRGPGYEASVAGRAYENYSATRNATPAPQELCGECEKQHIESATFDTFFSVSSVLSLLRKWWTFGRDEGCRRHEEFVNCGYVRTNFTMCSVTTFGTRPQAAQTAGPAGDV